MASVCLIVMCGLPASGKSTLCQKLIQQSGEGGLPYQFIVMEYDTLLPPDIEKTLIERGDENQCQDDISRWKVYRQDIYYCIDLFISMISLMKSTDNITSKTNESWNIESTQNKTELWQRFVEKYSQYCMKCCGEKPVCVVIDDNMYYRSMRYSYFQLARKYNTGYCQLYLQTDVGKAIKYNRQRPTHSVEDGTILQMAKRLEEPQPFKIWWEQNTLTLNNSLNINETCQLLYPIIDQALSHPIESLQEVDEEAANKSRVICSASFIHQSDNTVRKLVSQEMGKAKESGMTQSGLRSMAGKLQQVRRKIIEDLKDGTISVPKDIVTKVTGDSKDSKDESNIPTVFYTELFDKIKCDIVK